MDLCCVLSFDTCFTRPPALLPIFFGLCIPSFWLFDNAREIITFFFKKKKEGGYFAFDNRIFFTMHFRTTAKTEYPH